ncbi:carbonic anhydrase family protein [Listeria booriae]|uniref:carbonic anhydrase family protein n=1 Tax=Listeria booriae TaxID=1552123 RepID=UPI0016282B29|nr:carbonic anhydrase family protein [Listeria booriae]MBC2159785.1 carbonic anhydrase family protein [Listeria booriae]MBC2162115.1 carbonic anhydrase family protein [Listeria booriae]MBC2170256.1 carbonic anhydrase family protein [Listeria booriae]MBC2195349.1 carbonic anhydrase family protein [Listeria booriae]
MPKKKVITCIVTIAASCVLVLGACSSEDSTSKTKDTKTTQTTTKKTTEKTTLDWSYQGDTDPSHWGSIKKEYKISDTGKKQSPINIDTKKVKEDKTKATIEYKYQPTMFKVTRKDQTIQAIAQSAKGRQDSKVKVAGKEYVLKEINIHTPSEHQLDGKDFAAELQLKHVSSDNKTLIISVFVNQGEENQAIADIPSIVAKSKNGETTAMKQAVSTLGIIPSDDNKVFAYEGSFTTPATNEGVTWMVYETPMTMSKQQLQDLKTKLNDNNRPVQALNNRQVMSN